MRILAIDTALGACAACIIDTQAPEHFPAENASDADPLFSDLISYESFLLSRGHAEALLPLIERVVIQSVAGCKDASAQAGFAALDRVAVTVGPGSFTGLRVGISAARAIGLAANIPVIGISTLTACLAPLVAMGDVHRPILAAAIDARHGALYFQASTYDGQDVVPARHITIKDAASLLGSEAIAIAGPAAELLANEAESIGLDVHLADASPAPDIRWIARLGLAADATISLPEPLYLRGADAKPQDRARLPRQ